MYEYYLIFVVKSKVSKLQKILRISPCILSWLQKACLSVSYQFLEIQVIFIKQKNLHPATRSSNNRQTSQTPKFQAQILLEKKKKNKKRLNISL